jgi:hypothetical protein
MALGGPRLPASRTGSRHWVDYSRSLRGTRAAVPHLSCSKSPGSSRVGALWGRAMKKLRCAACRKQFTPKGHVLDQQYCSDRRCQRERRRRWQQDKRRSDRDYRENEQRAQQSWGQEHPEYWRRYRQEHPEYQERNRAQQRDRDRRRRRGGSKGVAVDGHVLANGDASEPIFPLQSGTYELRPAGDGVLANEDALRVKISFVSATWKPKRGKQVLLANEDVIGRGTESA